MRVGVLSLAHVHADGFLERLKGMEDVELVGFSDEVPERAEAATRAHGVRAYPSHEALLAAGLEAVVVCSENARHREHVELAAKAGCHVLVEKPIEATLEAAVAMREACETAGVRFMTAFPMRFDPSMRRLRERVRGGELGRVYGANGVNHSEAPDRHRAWFADKALAGGGAVMDHTVHLTDLYRWLFDGEVATVHAEVGNPFRPDLAVDTAGLALLTFENGVFASVDCSWSRPATYPRWGHLRLEIVGERGGLEADAFAQHLRLYAGERPAWPGWGSDATTLMLEEFVSSVREDREPSVTWQDGYEALRVALACYESAARGGPVELER